MRVISYDTYANYAKKYGIALKSGERKKTMPMLAKQIYAHEKARPKLRDCTSTDGENGATKRHTPSS